MDEKMRREKMRREKVGSEKVVREQTRAEEQPQRRVQPRSHFGLTILFSAAVFAILVITAALMALVIVIAYKMGVITEMVRVRPLLPIMIPLLTSVLVGTIISLITSRFLLRPIRAFIQAMNRLASGDFSTRVSFSRSPEFAELSESFNSMARELGNVELLRSDFVDNFSHEFKTPIVSIKGFAEMLKYGDLTETERAEYLDIVISEASRLARLATNVLNLSKLEKQDILSEKTEFCVSEQIRQSAILLQQKWEERGLTVFVDDRSPTTDIRITGNEEMLSHVWVNLLDNAIKYSPLNGTISIVIERQPGWFQYTIHNDGEAIPDEARSHIFDKFYQADESHSSAGNGLGLTLVKRIVELHKGEVSYGSGKAGTEFIVRLPIQ